MRGFGLVRRRVLKVERQSLRVRRFGWKIGGKWERIRGIEGKGDGKELVNSVRNEGNGRLGEFNIRLAFK